MCDGAPFVFYQTQPVHAFLKALNVFRLIGYGIGSMHAHGLHERNIWLLRISTIHIQRFSHHFPVGITPGGTGAFHIRFVIVINTDQYIHALLLEKQPFVIKIRITANIKFEAISAVFQDAH